MLETTSYKDADKFAFLSEILRSVRSLRTGIISSLVSLGASVNHRVFTASFSNRRLWLSLNNVFLCGFLFPKCCGREIFPKASVCFCASAFCPVFLEEVYRPFGEVFNGIQEAMPGLGCAQSPLLIGSTQFVLSFRE